MVSRLLMKSTIRDYPFPSEQFIYDFRNYMARYNMKAVTMDIYLDVHQFRDHIMNHREAAERLKNDIKLAARLGFQNVRPLCLVPIDVIENCNAIGTPSASNLLHNSPENSKSSFFKCRIGNFFKIYMKHNTAEIPCAITVA